MGTCIFGILLRFEQKFMMHFTNVREAGWLTLGSTCFCRYFDQMQRYIGHTCTIINDFGCNGFNMGHWLSAYVRHNERPKVQRNTGRCLLTGREWMPTADGFSTIAPDGFGKGSWNLTHLTFHQRGAGPVLGAERAGPGGYLNTPQLRSWVM